MRVAFERADGGVSVVVGVAKEVIERDLGEELTQAEYERRVLQGVLPTAFGALLRLAEDWTPPPAGHIRDAWRIEDGEIVVDADVARALVRDFIRAERAPLLVALDGELMRAIEIMDDKEREEKSADIIRRKKALRDAPAHPLIDRAATPEALAAIRLADLLG